MANSLKRLPQHWFVVESNRHDPSYGDINVLLTDSGNVAWGPPHIGMFYKRVARGIQLSFSRHGELFAYWRRVCRAWNACIVAAELVQLSPRAHPGILADALADLGGCDGLEQFLREQFLPSGRASGEVLPEALPILPVSVLTRDARLFSCG